LPLLGKDIHLSSLTVVVSYPGSALQHIHRDYANLFEEGGIGSVLPVYAVNVAVPLIDVDIETGPTGFWPGSHRWQSTVLPQPQTVTVEPLRRGDCLLLDYRTLHTGLPNCSRHARPIAYLVYARPWFFDEVNHRARIPLDMSLEDYAALPESLRPLLIRAFSQAIRTRK
jgi:ectoine hydroxylase-related dioxygenase (phytanoyl-CoA dioxygenase family)